MPVEWRKPWYEVEGDAVAESLSAELHREVSAGHELYGVKGVVALGYRKDQDDVAFLLPDGRVAVVHLTWERRKVTPPAPTTEVAGSVEAFGEMVREDARGWGNW